MSRPPKKPDDRVQTSFRVPPDLLERIDEECEQRVIGRNLLLEWLIRKGFEHLPPLE